MGAMLSGQTPQRHRGHGPLLPPMGFCRSAPWARCFPASHLKGIAGMARPHNPWAL